MSSASGLNMFLSTLSSAVEKISPATPATHPAPAPPELAAGMPQPASIQPISIQPALIQWPPRNLAVAKDRTKDQPLPDGQPTEPSAATTPYMLAPALPVASLRLEGGDSPVAPDLSGGYASPTRPETSTGQQLVGVSAMGGTDRPGIAMHAATPLAFQLVLTTNSGAGAKQTLPLSGEISKPASDSGQQTSVPGAGPVLPPPGGNPEPSSGLAMGTGTERTSAAPMHRLGSRGAEQNAPDSSPLRHGAAAVDTRLSPLASRPNAVAQGPSSVRSSTNPTAASLPSDGVAPPNANLPSASLPSATLPGASLPSASLPSASLPGASLPSGSLPGASAARSIAGVPPPSWVSASPQSPLLGLGRGTSVAGASSNAARSNAGPVSNAPRAEPSAATSGRMDMATTASCTSQISAATVVSEAAGGMPSAAATSSNASKTSAGVSAPNPNAPGPSVAARVPSVPMPAAKPELSRPTSGAWVIAGASPQHTSDSQPPSVPEPTTSGNVAGPGGGSPPAAVTAMNFPRNPAPPIPEQKPAPTLSADTPGVSPLAVSSTKPSAGPANPDRSASGRRSSESPSKAAAPENITPPPQSIREPREGGQRRKEPGNVAADKLGPAQERPGPGDAFRQTPAGALQAREATRPRNANDTGSDTAEQPRELPTSIDPQPGRDAPPTAAARQISLKLAGAGSAGVAVQLRERAGRVEVAVRSGDSQLAKSLQSGLGDLVTRLENQGFKTQAWVPAAARQTATAPSSWESALSQQQQGHSNAGNGNQQRQGGSSQRRQPRPIARFEENMTDEDVRMKQK